MAVRRAGQLIECIHSVVYFVPEPQQAYASLGLRGYWRGYFAGRTAALALPSGTVDAETVTRLFAGFAPRFVARAVPDVWSITTPADVLAARSSGAVAALRRLVPVDAYDRVEPAAELLAEVIAAADLTRYALASAHAAVPAPADPLGALWHHATVLREFRGDAHLASVREHGLSWPQPNLLLLGIGRLDPQQRDYRGWTEDEWEAARAELDGRGLYGTESARELAEAIDTRTDELVASAWAAVHPARVDELLTPIARAAAAVLPFPNAIGLTDPFPRGSWAPGG